MKLSHILPSLLQLAMPSTTRAVTPSLPHEGAGGMPEHGAASGGCAIQLVLLETPCLGGSPVISPAVTGMYLTACHASLYMLAETVAERFAQTEGPNLPFLLHKKKNFGKKRRASVT